VQEGKTACWGADKSWARGCEISAALRTRRGGLVVASDKPFRNVTDHSPVWRTRLPQPGATTPREQEFLATAFTQSVKFEGMACTPDGCLCLATTSFSWFEEDDPQRDPWNNLVAWRSGAPEAAYLVNRSVRAGVASSMSLRPALRAALATQAHPAGPAWFKIEGLAVLPGRRLAFGVRALGTSYKPGEHERVAVVLAARYAFVQGRIHLLKPFRKILQWNASQLIGKPVGLSGLAYDPEACRLVLLTSYERDGASVAADHGAWCWALPLRALYSGSKAPTLIRDGRGRPLDLHHKAETIVPLGRRRFLVIHDDDDVLGTEVDPPAHAWPRKANEACYSYLTLCR